MEKGQAEDTTFPMIFPIGKKENLISDCQQFHKDQQNKRTTNDHHKNSYCLLIQSTTKLNPIKHNLLKSLLLLEIKRVLLPLLHFQPKCCYQVK